MSSIEKRCFIKTVYFLFSKILNESLFELPARQMAFVLMFLRLYIIWCKKPLSVGFVLMKLPSAAPFKINQLMHRHHFNIKFISQQYIFLPSPSKSLIKIR
jgi:hypothetical protein